MNRCLVAVAAAIACGLVRAAEVSAEDAKTAVSGWVSLKEALSGEFNAEIESVTAYEGEGGKGKFYCVSFSGGGYVLTTSDTDTVPVAAYSAEGTFEATYENPLYCMMVRDAAARAARLEGLAAAAQTGRAGAGAAAATPNQAAWARLKAAATSATTGRAGAGSNVSSPSTILVSPLLTTKWDQKLSSSGYCYNYYTPNHYPCGCAATAGAQVMKYFAWPKTEVEALTTSCMVDGAATNLTMLGGTYEWNKMVSSGSDSNRAAVGKLCYDVGVSLEMRYSSSGSGANSVRLSNSYTNVFGYSNACWILIDGGISREQYNKTILCNLFAKKPCILAIKGRTTGSSSSDSSHAIVADGCGTAGDTVYTHLNMGWGGTSDAWYTPVWNGDATGLADINATDGGYIYTNVNAVVFNIFTNETKYSSIACGRITDVANGNAAVYGATVTAKAGGVVKATAKTDSKGVYALLLPPTDSQTTYTLTAEAPGYINNQTLQVKAKKTTGIRAAYYTGNKISYYDTDADLQSSNSYGNDFEFSSFPAAADVTCETPDEFEGTASVALACATQGARIYYTLDGSDPFEGVSPAEGATLYTGPIALTATTTVKARATSDANSPSTLFTRRFVKIGDIDDFFFRHDFSKGTRNFVKGTCASSTDLTAAGDGATAVPGPAGVAATAAHPLGAWGAFGSTDGAVLDGPWSVAMHLQAPAVANGVIFSIGRARTAKQKEVIVCASGDGSKLYLKHITTTDSNSTKSLDGTDEIAIPGGFARGWHTLVVAFVPSENGAGGTFKLYWDGAIAGTGAESSSYKYSNDGGLQYGKPLSFTDDNLSDFGLKSLAKNTAYAVRDMRFYSRDVTSIEAAAFEAACEEDRHADVPDLDAYAYVQSAGVNALDTGYTAVGDSRFAVDFEFTQTAGWKSVFGWYESATAPFHELFLNGNTIFALRKGDAEIEGGNNMSCNRKVDAGGNMTEESKAGDTERHVAVLHNLGVDDKKANVKLYDYGDRTVYWKNYSNTKTVNTLQAGGHTYLFARNASDDTSNLEGARKSSCRVYSFLVDETADPDADVTVPAAFLAPDVLPDGTAGFRNVVTGAFCGEAAESPSTALAYVNGVGGASDYKHVGGVFSARFWARSSDAAKGGVKFAGQTAAGTNSLFTARHATATLTAESNAAGAAFDHWEGDTWAIRNGGKTTDATIAVKSDTAIQLKAVFMAKAPTPSCADADANGNIPMLLPGTLTLSVPEGATLYYTLDGTDPTTESASTTTGEIEVPAGTATVKAFSAGGDWTAGDTATFTIRDAAAAIEDFAFRHDFTAGTYTAIKGSADLPAMNWTNYTNKAAFEDDAGNFAGYNPSETWGNVKPLLAADWSVAVRVRQVATEGGVVLGVGLGSGAGVKEVALCSSSDPDKMTVKTIVNAKKGADNATLEGSTEMTGFGDTAGGFHSLVLAFKRTAEGSGEGVFTLFFDGRAMGTHETSSANGFGTSASAAFQYCTMPSMNNTHLVKFGLQNTAGSDMAFLDMRFYDRALTRGEAAAFAAIEYSHKTSATPDFAAAACVEAFGENYIDTLWKAPKNASFAADFAFTDKDTVQKRIFGIYNGDNTKFAEDGLVHGFYINGSKKFAFVKASAYTGSDGGTWISTGVDADTNRHRFTLKDKDSTDAGSECILYNHGNAAAVKTTASKRTHNAAALRSTYVFACNKAGTADWNAKAKLYSFEASAGGTEPALHLAPVALGDGKIGLRDTKTGRFYADAAANPATALSYSDGIGRAADWKSEKGYLYARFRAASTAPAFGGVKFGDAAAAANADAFVKRGESVQLEAVATEGCLFVEWQGDTWAIQDGGKATDAAVSVKNDAPIALKAVFERDEAANMPDKFVEYVESNAGQFIDTGVEAKAGIYAEMGVAWTDVQSYNCFLGAKDTAASGKNVILAMRQTKYLFLKGYGTVGANYEDATLPTLTAGTFRDIKTEISPSGVWTATIDNESSVADFSELEGALDTGLTMYAFARHVNTGGGIDCKSNARCRYLRIWAWNADSEQYELKRWYRPCVKDGRAALYDEVSQIIFYSRSGADFAAGPDFDMMPEAYVQGYGTGGVRTAAKGNTIDTGLTPDAGMTFKADYRFTLAYAQERVFGVRGGYNVNHYCNGSKQFAFNMASDNRWVAMTDKSGGKISVNTNRHWIAMSASPNANSATATLSQDVRTNIVSETTDSSATKDKEATGALYLLSENNGGFKNPSFAMLYTFLAEKDGAPVAFFAPARDAATGRAGVRNIVTGEFHGEGNDDALSPLLYREGIGSADDYKYEGGTLSMKVYAKAGEGGSILFNGGVAEGTGEFGFPYGWCAYGESATLAAVPKAGFAFVGWQGDTWAIRDGGKTTDRTIAVKSDTAIQLKAVFAKRTGVVFLVK